MTPRCPSNQDRDEPATQGSQHLGGWAAAGPVPLLGVGCRRLGLLEVGWPPLARAHLGLRPASGPCTRLHVMVGWGGTRGRERPPSLEQD